MKYSPDLEYGILAKLTSQQTILDYTGNSHRFWW